MSDWLVLPAFAKINLGLELLGQRRDRYWEIATIYQTVSLADRLRLRLRRSSGILLRVSPGTHPADQGNLVWRALALARRRFGIRPGVEAELQKKIPVGAGLGGGSSNAAAAVIGLLRLARRRVERDELLRLGAALGADVAFFFLGGRALGVGRGDEVYPLDDLPATPCLLVCPRLNIPTGDAYRWARLPNLLAQASLGGQARLTPHRVPGRMEGFSLAPERAEEAANDFERIVFPRFPELARIKRQLAAAGAQPTALSGSGSTIYALFRQLRTARAVARSLRRAGIRVFVVRTVSRERYARALGLPAASRPAPQCGVSGESSRGRTSAFGAEDLGSNPSSPATSGGREEGWTRIG